MNTPPRQPRPNDPGWTGWNGAGQQQCRTCWKWQYPAIHSCPGVPQPGATPPPDAPPPGQQVSGEQLVGLTAFLTLGGRTINRTWQRYLLADLAAARAERDALHAAVTEMLAMCDRMENPPPGTYVFDLVPMLNTASVRAVLAPWDAAQPPADDADDRVMEVDLDDQP